MQSRWVIPYLVRDMIHYFNCNPFKNHPRITQIQAFFMNLAKNASHRRSRADMYEMIGIHFKSKLTRFKHSSPRTSLWFLYSHQVRRFQWRESPSAQHKASQQCVVLLIFTQLMRKSVRAQQKRTASAWWRNARTSPKKKKKNTQVGERVWREIHVFPVPFPSRLHSDCWGRISPLDQVSGGPHRCAAVSSAVINMRTNPDSPENQPIAWEKWPRCSQHPGSGWLRGAVIHIPEACSHLCLLLLEVKHAAKNIHINKWSVVLNLWKARKI